MKVMIKDIKQLVEGLFDDVFDDEHSLNNMASNMNT